MPELRKEDVKVTVENGVLTISGERKFEKEEKKKKYHRVERGYGSFVRTFALPEDADADKVKAVFKHGMLSSLRRAALIAVLAGAGASLAFMLRASHRQNSRVLLLLFGIWVLFPFITAVWAYVVSNGWTVVVRVPLYMVMLVVSLVSLSIYGGVAFRHLRAKVGFVFLVVPLASWLVIAIAVSIATVVSRRQSRRAGDA